MTVSSEVKRSDFAGNGSTTAFATGFRFLQNSDIKVILTVNLTGVETKQTEITNYTLTGAGLDAGGTVTMLIAPATGETLTIKRNLPLTQNTDYVENDRFPAESHEDALDRLTMIVQQQQEEIDRSLKLAETSQSTDVSIPDPVAGKFLKWNDAEDGLDNTDVSLLSPGDIDSLSIPHIFTSVAAFKASLIEFPDGKTIRLLDRGADFTKISGQSGAGFKTIPSTSVNQSVDLIVTDKTTLPAFGVVMDGSVESSAALIEALAFNIKPTEGVVLLNPATPIVIDTDKNKLFVGYAPDVLEFVTDIDDGRTIFEMSGQFHTVRDFSINSRLGVSKNFTGMVFGNQSEGTSFTRSRLETKVSNAGGTGLEVRGWNNDIKYLSKFNERGFKGRELNASVITIISEDDERPVDIEEIFGTQISQLTLERVNTQVSVNPSRIDKFNGLHIGSIYTEGGGWQRPCIEFGQSIKGNSLTISSGNITGVSADGQPMISFVAAESITANMDVFTGSTPAVVNFGAGVDYVDSKVVGQFSLPEPSRNKRFTQDNSKSVQIHANYSGDTYLDHFLATFTLKTDSNVVLTEENTELRSGERGIRITANAGTHLAVTSLRRQVSHFDKVANLAGKTVKAFAWIFVPDLPVFADLTITPAFSLTAVGTASSFPAAQRAMIAGQWNLVESEDLTIPWAGAAGDQILFDFFVGHTSETFDGSEYIIVDSIFLTETKCNIRDIMQGRIRESAKYTGIKTDGDLLQIHSQTYQSLTASYITLSVGEVEVKRAAPAASGKIGAVVTTAGTLGGTAIFKFYGPIDA